MSATRAPVLACLSASLILLSTPLALAEPSTDEASRPADATADTTPVQTADVGAPADPSKAEQPKPKERKGIEEITVTARRTEENIQATPVTVTAFDAEDLEENDIRSLEDIQQFVPNLQFDQAAGSSNASRIYLRGVGNGDTIITDDNGVGIYVDSVFLPRAAGTLLTVSDVERVEVLAGPQGTLYGKNTIGGLVNYITKKPQWEYEARGSVRVGTYGTFDTGGMFNVPVVDERAALRVSFATRSNDGYQKNSFRDQDTQDTRSLNGRVQLRLQPADSLEILFSGAQSISRERGYTPKCKLNDPALLDVQGNIERGNLSAQLFPTFGQECFDDEQRRSVRRVARDGQLEDYLKTVNTYMQLNWSPAEWITLKSNTAWNRNDTSSSGDPDATALPFRNGLPSDFDKGEQDSIAQELNLSGDFEVADRKVEWIGGVFGLVEDNFDKLFTTGTPSTVTEAGGTPVQFDRVIAPFNRMTDGPTATPIETIVATGGIQAAINANPNVLMAANGFGPCDDAERLPLEMVPGSGVAVRNVAGDQIFTCRRTFEGVQTKARLRSNVLSYAAFSSFDIELTDSLKLAAGVRYTHERRRVSRFRQVNENDRGRLVSPAPRANPAIPGVNRVSASLRTDGITTNFERSIRIGKWTPSLSLTYLVNDDLTFFLSTARGFKSGGFNGRVEGDGNERVEYDPEQLVNYEAGVKSQWFDNRLIVNATYFQSRYKDIQLPNVQVTNGARVSVVVDNAGLALLRGMDLQMTARLTDALTLRGTLGITKGRYKEFDGGNPDDRLIGTPTYTGNLTATYRMDVGRFGELTSRLSWSHQGQKASDSADFRATHVDKYGTMGAGLTLALPDGKTRIALNGSNLTNRTYFLTGIFLGDSTLRYFAPPRTFSLELRREF
jgi:iron complex outermembrane recepter protein